MTIKAVLFDLDGVLLDATEVHYSALNEALKECGYSEISRKDHETTYNGIPTREKLRLLNITLEDQEKIQQKKQQITISEIKKLKPIPDIVDTLGFLFEKKYKIACCSNSIKQTIVEGLSSGGLIHFFDLIVSNEDVEKSKPHPEMYLNAMKFFRLYPKQCLIIEDSDKGYQAAVSSGGSVVRVKNPYEINVDFIKKAIYDNNLP